MTEREKLYEVISKLNDGEGTTTDGIIDAILKAGFVLPESGEDNETTRDFKKEFEQLLKEACPSDTGKDYTYKVLMREAFEKSIAAERRKAVEESEDKKLLDFLDRENARARYTGQCIFRLSTTGRGWRLHEHSGEGVSNTAREAIKQALLKFGAKELK